MATAKFFPSSNFQIGTLSNCVDTLNEEYLLRDSIYAFRELSKNDTLINLGGDDDNIYQNFFDFCNLGNVGKFQKVNNYVVDSLIADTTAAIITNNNIPTRCKPEENQRNVNSVYLRQITYEQDTANIEGLRYEFTEEDITLLEEVAYQNSEKGGEAVNMARVMLGLDLQDDDENAMRTPHHNAKSEINTPQFLLFPNPNNGEMELSYVLEEGERGYLKILNLLGETISAYKLSTDINLLKINEPGLRSGFYFYEIYLNDKKVYTNKLIVNK